MPRAGPAATDRLARTGALAAEFAARMARLGPFEPRPRLAAAVSGGPDSMALVLLAQDWAAGRGGSVLALIVDHGLRAASAAEARVTRERLARCGIAARVLRLAHLTRGPALAERARIARYQALEAACAREGMLHLLLGHQAADQAETVLMRALAGSGTRGLAGMAALAERPRVRLLRPLLDVSPGRLRAGLAAAGWDWVADPSNADTRTTRARIRALRLDRDGDGPATRALAAAARAAGAERERAEARVAAELATHVRLRPEGFAVLAAATLSAPALARVVAAIGGRARPVANARVAELAARPRAATVAGVRLMPAGRLGPGWLVVREAAGMAAPVAAAPGGVWDGRFRLVGVRLGRGLYPSPQPPSHKGRGDSPIEVPPPLVGGGQGEGALPDQPLTVGALGDDARRFRRRLPAAVLRTLPAIRAGGRLVAVPHLGWPEPAVAARFTCLFAPALPAGPAPFVPG